MIYLLLHDDWEIYGDGSGNPKKLMFDPAERLLNICDNYNAKYTFYAEVGQQLHMLNAPDSKWKKYANTWEAIMKDAVARGHDVQLHLHPQWIGAKLVDGAWKLDHSKWNTGKLPFEMLDEWIGKGVQYLRSLLKPVNPDYEVLSYRAGGWFCQPSTNLYKALKKHGILSDVSVLRGRFKHFNDGGHVDFRNVPSEFYPWEVDPNNFANCIPGSGFWELPVYTETSILPHPIYLLTKSFSPFYYSRIFKQRRNQKLNSTYTLKVVESTKQKDYYGSFGYMHYKHLLNYVDTVKGEAKKTDKEIPLIFVTHSKNFLDYNNFERLLKILSQDPAVSFATTCSFLGRYLS